MQAWDAGGATDVDNGFSQCRRHHRMLHAGYRVEGDPNGELRFYRPGGWYIASTYPAARVFARRAARGPDMSELLVR